MINFKKIIKYLIKGLYNGLNERSHRVRIPALISVEAYFPIESANDIITYHFDARKGMLIFASF